MSKVSKTKLGDIGKISMCKRILKSQTSSKGDIPFYKISTFGGKADCFISRKLYEEYKTKYSFPTKGAVLISAAGTLGRTVIYNGEDAFFQDSNIVWVDNDESKVLNDFLYYYYQLKPWKKTTGSTIERLYNDNLRDIDVIYPTDIIEQKKLIKVLKGFDSKINNNNKIILELESMAKTIYDYWFLQYEFPNEEGKPYKSSGGKMIYNEILKREIPVGWDVKSIKECIEHINTGLNPRDNFVLGNGNIKYITVKNLTKEGIFNYDGCDVIDEKAKEIVHNRSDVDVGDILFASIAPLGRCFLVQEYPKEWDINESVFCIRPNQQIIPTEYLYLYLTSDMFIKQAENSSTGSIFSGIRINTLESMNLLVPNEKIKEKFTHNIENIFLKKYKIAKENEELTKLRDELLPLLMNGQVSFKN